MVAVDAGRNGGLREVAGHELQERHLRRGILHVHPVGVELEVGLAPNVTTIVCVGEERLLDNVEMAVEDLLGQRQSAISQHPANFRVVIIELLVSRGQDGRGVGDWSRVGG